MGKQKQPVISRFFAPKPKPPPDDDVPSSSSTPTPTPTPLPSASAPPPKTPPPKIAATVTCSPAKRHLTPPRQNPKKRPKPTPSQLQQQQQQQQPTYTPLELQVVDLKSKYPDVLLMIEVGYKYRFFGEDAEIAARVLGIYAHQDRNFMTASVPTFRLNVHVRRLVNSGCKVGVVKQTETAAIKAHGENKGGPFCRGLSALYTKATLEAAEDMGGSREDEGFGGGCNYLVCVVERNVVVRNLECAIESGFDVKIGVVAVEVSTGEVVYGEFNDNAMRTGLEAVVLSLSPAELLLGEPLSSQTKKLLLGYVGPASNVRVEHVSRDCFEGGGALAEVISLFDKMNEDSASDSQKKNSEEREPPNQTSAIEVIMNMPDLAVQALALTIRHLKQFGFERILCLGASFRPYSRSMEMSLSANALQQLEVLRNNSDGSEAGSLLQIMNHTLTAYGSRLLRHWVTHPLCDKSMISARLDAVAEIAETMGSSNVKQNENVLDQKDIDIEVVWPEFYAVLSSMLTSLGRSPDLQRGTTRIFYRTATTSEFIAVMQAILYAAKQLKQLNIEDYSDEPERSGCLRSVLLRKLISTASSSNLIANCAKLLSAVNKEAAEEGDFCNLMINGDGQFPEVVNAREAVQLATDRLDSLIVMLRKQLGMRNIQYISVSGVTHLIELPVDVKVPSNWVKVNSTKKTIRYHPPEVLTAVDQLTLAKEKLMIACQDAWNGFLEEFAKYYAEFRAAIQALATLDCLHSLAILSKNKNYVCPYFVDDDDAVQIHLHSGRHPVLETLLQDSFVPNDTNLHGDNEFCQIVTGPNMGGKSCYIRQVALIAIMAQVGSYVPASSAKLHVLDGIYTRMGASDSIQQGRSTFLEELTEASLILRNCTGRSLVIIDELGRGTSTHDGVAIAYATLHHLINQKRCMILFVTHYPKVAEIQSEFPGSVGAYHVSYLASSKDEGSCPASEHEDVIYLYKLKSGVSEKSFGFNVAQLAQVPPSCINRAVVMSSKLEAAVSRRIGDGLARESVKEYQGGRVENTRESTTAFKEFFSNLKSALEETDVEKSFGLLSHARSLSKELTSTT